MGFKKLSGESIIKRNAWLVLVRSAATGQKNIITDLGGNNIFASWYSSECEKIWKFITTKPVDDVRNFVNVDKALSRVEGFRFFYPVKDQNGAFIYKTSGAKADVCAKFIADWMAEKEFYFEDTAWTIQEREEYLNTTIGAALNDFGCFVSQRVNTAPIKGSSAANVNVGNQNIASNSTIPGAPKNNYKSLGPLSSNVTILTTGSKENFLSQGINIVYCINGNKTGANVPNAFITPVTNSGAAINAGKARTVFFGSGNGYSDCKLYFKDYQEAERFCDKVNQKFLNTKFSGISVVKAKVQPGDNFFEVDTEFGLAWIKSSKLNETLAEAFLENKKMLEVEEQCRISKDDPECIHDFDLFEDSFRRHYD